MKEKVYGFYSGHVDAEISAGRLSDQGIKCDYVVLSVWTGANDTNDTLKPGLAIVATAQVEAYWGFGNECVHPIYPGQTVPFLIPVLDARDISVRANKNAGKVTVMFSCFRIGEIEE